MREADGLGFREHVRRTLERSRAAIEITHDRTGWSRTLLDQSAILVDRSATLVQTSQAIRAELRASVTAYVNDLRADGVPPQRMVVLVKTAIREAVPPDLDAGEARELMEDVVRWSVDAYYDAA